MGIKRLKSKLKPIVLLLAPKYYHKRLIRQSIKEMKVNSISVNRVLSVAYDPAGKYPTMYEKPQLFYEKRKHKMEFDKNGIPMLMLNGNRIYHPTYIIQYALSEYNFYLFSHASYHFEVARKTADWLVRNQDPDSGCWYYTYDYKHEFTRCLLEAPWASAMAQGQGISLLTRMYHITKEQIYLDTAQKATTLLDIPIESGGLASEFLGHTVFEEYPTIPYSITLNGFMFCALGLYDLSRMAKDERVAGLWRTAKETLTFMVPLYDGDVMSTYCLSYVTVGNIERHWADQYHPIHITLLQCFESFMPNPTFEFYIKRWAGFFGIDIEE